MVETQKNALHIVDVTLICNRKMKDFIVTVAWNIFSKPNRGYVIYKTGSDKTPQISLSDRRTIASQGGGGAKEEGAEVVLKREVCSRHPIQICITLIATINRQ